MNLIISTLFPQDAFELKPKKKIIRKKVVGTPRERFESQVRNQSDYIIDCWYINTKKKCYRCFGNVDDNEPYDIIQELYEDEFVENCFNHWDTKFNFYRDNKTDIDELYNVADFIALFSDCQKWFSSEFDTDLLIKDCEDAWNSIVYWLVKDGGLLNKEFDAFLQEKYKTYLDSKRTCRIACGICYENKILYTGCSCCNGNFICEECYECLDNKNSCPYCRCEEMIDRDPPQVSHSQDEITDKAELMITLKRYTENPVMEKCEDCQCDIRYRDKSHYSIDDTGDVNVESLFCDECFKKEEESFNDMCDCCVKGWDTSNEFGRCECWCYKCDRFLRDCKYTC